MTRATWRISYARSSRIQTHANDVSHKPSSGILKISEKIKHTTLSLQKTLVRY